MFSPVIIAPCDCFAESWPEAGWSEWESDDPARTNARYVRLMLVSDDSDGNVWDSEGVSSPLWTLPVSRSLIDAIQRWSADHADAEGWSHGDHLHAKESEGYPRNLMNRRGEALATWLRDELGRGWVVEHSWL